MSMNKSKNNFKAQNGDTIVEVMISLALLSTAFISCYSIFNKSTRNLEAAQLRSQAIKLVSSQIQALRSYYIANNESTPNNLSCFFLQSPASPTLVVYTMSPCYLNSSGYQDTTNTTPKYTITISSNSSTDPSDPTYTVTATWPYSNSTGQVSMEYRVQ